MFATLKQVVGENWHWRRQVWNLAKIDLVKTYRGAALGKIWLFAKPAVYILVFWVALKFGLRSSSDVNGKPFANDDAISYWPGQGTTARDGNDLVVGMIFTSPTDRRTQDYITGRFG